MELPKVPGAGTEVVHNSQKFRAGTKHAVPVPRVLWHGRTEPKSSGHRYKCRTELPQVPGTGMNVLQKLQKLQKFFVG